MEQASAWEICERIVNTLNHVMIGFVAIWITWFSLVSISYGLFNLHVFLTTIGFQLLMAESILVFYSNNSWSNLFRRTTKNHVHWVLQALGASCALIGVGLECYRRNWYWNFHRNHTIYGKKFKIII